MKLKNKKGIERNFRVLFEFDKDDKKYIIYKDINTLSVYGGRIEEKVLKPLDDGEYALINNIIERMNG